MNLLDDFMFWWGPDWRRLGSLLCDLFTFRINRLSEIKEHHFGAYSQQLCLATLVRLDDG
jgi:hypothetical protein